MATGTTSYMAKVLYKFDASSESQLSLVPGQIIEVSKKYAQGWSFGKNNTGKSGLFPSTYVEEVKQEVKQGSQPPPGPAANSVPLSTSVVSPQSAPGAPAATSQPTPTPSSTAQPAATTGGAVVSTSPPATNTAVSVPLPSGMVRATVIKDFDSKNPTNLALKKGEIIVVQEQFPTGWARAQSSSGKTGLVPRNVLAFIENSKFKAIAMYDYTAGNASELTFKKDDELDIMNDTLPNGWWLAQLGSKIGRIPSGYVKRVEAPQTTPVSSDTPATASGTTTEAQNQPTTLSQPNTTFGSTSNSFGHASELAPKHDGSKTTETVTYPHKARAKYPYNARKPSELSLAKGDEITILKPSAKGWALATLKDKQGYVPASFVEKIETGDSFTASSAPSASTTQTPVATSTATTTSTQSSVPTPTPTPAAVTPTPATTTAVTAPPAQPSTVAAPPAQPSAVVTPTPTVATPVETVVQATVPSTEHKAARPMPAPPVATASSEVKDPYVPPAKFLHKAIALHDYKPTRQNELALSKGTEVYILKILERGWVYAWLKGTAGVIPGKYVKEITTTQPAALPTQTSQSISAQPASIQTTPTPTTVQPTTTPVQPIQPTPASVQPTLTPLTSQPETVPLKPTAEQTPTQNNNQEPTPTPTPAKQDVSVQPPSEKMPEKAEAIYGFTPDPKADAQLPLRVGEIITILSKADNGWWYGENSEKVSGHFPATYVKLLPVLNGDTKQPEQPKPVEVTAEKPVIQKPEIKPEPQAEIRVEPKPEIKEEPKLEPKPEPKVEPKPEPKPEPKVDRPKVEVRTEHPDEPKPEPKVEVKQTATPATVEVKTTPALVTKTTKVEAEPAVEHTIVTPIPVVAAPVTVAVAPIIPQLTEKQIAELIEKAVSRMESTLHSEISSLQGQITSLSKEVDLHKKHTAEAIAAKKKAEDEVSLCAAKVTEAERLAKVCEERAAATETRIKEVERRLLADQRLRRDSDALVLKLQADLDALQAKVEKSFPKSLAE
ncbi:hypothetical protein Pelo_1273 [Pelomyxa schiedti]|nr:hypothetical protein Pelo_1273 [Pelomyxa schiedti]